MADEADGHFWFRGTRRVIVDWARRAAGRPLEELRIADVGCGPGTTMAWLPDSPHLVGLDAQPLALTLAKTRAPRAGLVAADAEELPLGEEVFDLVLCLDMLEHLDHPEKAVEGMFRALRPGGSLVATVPAWPFLFSTHDQALGHRRRYRRPGLKKLISSAGFELRRISYYNALLFPPIAAVRLLRRGHVDPRPPDEQEVVESDLKPLPAPISRLLEETIAVERYLLRFVSFPFGVSLIAWAKKPA
jgi:SAM-dependent methyltransferase